MHRTLPNPYRHHFFAYSFYFFKFFIQYFSIPASLYSFLHHALGAPSNKLWYFFRRSKRVIFGLVASYTKYNIFILAPFANMATNSNDHVTLRGDIAVLLVFSASFCAVVGDVVILSVKLSPFLGPSLAIRLSFEFQASTIFRVFVVFFICDTNCLHLHCLFSL